MGGRLLLAVYCYSCLHVRKNKWLCALVLLNWQAMNFFVVDHSRSVHVALYVSSTILGEQSSESLVDVERQEPSGWMVWLVSTGQTVWGKCDNFLAFSWLLFKEEWLVCEN